MARSVSLRVSPPAAGSKGTTTTKSRVVGARASYGQLPLSFEANEGQTDKRVRFFSRGAGYSLFLTPTEAVLALSRQSSKPHASTSGAPASVSKAPSAVLRMKLAGANAQPRVSGAGVLPGKVNYFLGRDKSKWRTNVSTYSRVRYQSVYRGVDLVYYGNQRQLEYDFIVAPHADAAQIKLGFSGADKVALDKNGDLVLQAGGGSVRWHKPIAYQQIGGKRRTVASTYKVSGRSVGFQLASYDRTKPLVIDPTLVYSTYLGGSGSDSGSRIAVDASGNAYVSGSTVSANFPTAGALQAAGGSFDAFVSKLNAAGSALIYSTYLGGSMMDVGGGIAVDASGNAYLTGNTVSDNFPTTANALQISRGGLSDAFVTKLDATGSALAYSTYLGGSDSDGGLGIAVDGSGNAHVTGRTRSTSFPTVNAVQGTNTGGNNGFDDAFVSKLNAAGSALIYSTYLGGSSTDVGNAIALDGSGNAYITGQAESANFPTVNALQGTIAGAGSTDAFVSKINAAGSALVYSTFLGGNGDDLGQGIAVDGAGNAYVCGRTVAPDFPTVNALQAGYGGFGDGFVSKLNAAGSALAYSTYLGGSDSDTARSIAVDSGGSAFVTGATSSSNFRLVSPLQSTRNGTQDAFVSRLSAAGSALLYSTFLGGSDVDDGLGIAIDSSANAFVTGSTSSANFPTASPLQAANGGSGDGFISKLSPLPRNVVTNTNDSGAGSLRDAIDFANANPGTTISFNIPGAGVQTITPQSALPTITAAGTVIDGYTQPGSSPNTLAVGSNAVLLIELNGAAAGTVGLFLQGGNSTVRGLVINRSPGSGILAITGGNNTITGNFLGTDATGTIDLGNAGNGIQVASSPNNTIGGTAPAARNVLSGNDNSGISLEQATTTGTIVRGNIIGTNALGTAILANNFAGISTGRASGSTIGGAAAGAGNLISGNNGGGISLSTNSDNTVVQGNLLGTNASGAAALPAGGNGIALDRSSNCTIGGSAPGEGNVIAGFNNGILFVTIGGSETNNNVVQGNKIGTNLAGSAALPNNNGIVFTASQGTNAPSLDNIIGGTTAGARNIISGNTTNGVLLGFASNTSIQGNYIGVANDGTTALGNGDSGVYVTYSGNSIGGGVAGAGNIIAYNGRHGVQVGYGGATTYNIAVRRNSIFSNAQLGIDLSGNGVTPNDAGDPDTNDNSLQNFPVITSVTNGADSVITGTLNSTPGATFTIDLYSNDAVDPSGYGEGQTYRGSTSATTDTTTGNATFTFTTTGVNLTGKFVSATTTNAAGDTSEFSQALQVLAPRSTVTNTGDSNAVGSGSLRDAINFANANPGTTISFAIPPGGLPSGVESIVVGSALPAITADGTIIDGSTQTTFGGDTNTSGPEVEINGSAATGTPNGLLISGAANCIIDDLVINNFMQAGVRILNATATQNTVRRCYIGTDPSGALARANLDGIVIGGGAHGNIIGGNNLLDLSVTQRNLISGNSLGGVVIADPGSDGNAVKGNFIGTNAANTAALPNGRDGVIIFNGAKSNIIGVTTANSDTGNCIAGNTRDGVRLAGGGVDGNLVQTNTIGTDNAGGTAIPNSGDGVHIEGGAKNNIVGGANQDNLISGNTGNGVTISGAGTDGNKVLSNNIGTDGAGGAAIPNLNGVVIDAGAQSNIIGGNPASEGNILSGNTQSGVLINGFNTQFNRVRGNFIGTTSTGTTPLPNGDGVVLDGQCTNNTIGGSGNAGEPGSIESNTISGNTGAGLILFATGNSVSSNFIGTSADGTAAVANAVGVRVVGDGNVIGVSAAGNIIAGNTGVGVSLESIAANNQLRQNMIGVGTAGALGNGGAGVVDTSTGSGNAIGDISSSLRTQIANNNGAGVALSAGTGTSVVNSDIFANQGAGVAVIAGTSHRISLNNIRDNSGLGIDLGNDGVTPNDAQDGDTGANQLQNFPVISGATAGGQVTGTFNSTPSSTFTLEFFSSPSTDPSGFGEGGAYLGNTSVTTDANGDAGFSFSPTVAIASGEFVTATATDDFFGNTSEFSNAVQVLGASARNIVTNTNDSGAGSLRDAIDFANANPNTTIEFNISATGVQTIAPATSLPAITASGTVIDGYTQQGSSPNTLQVGDNAVLKIELNGAGAGPSTSGLTFSAPSFTVRGLAINRFSYSGIEIGHSGTPGGTSITGCFIGTNAAGTVALPNGIGIYISSSTPGNAAIGGPAPAERNIISGNTGDGVFLNADTNSVQNNYIGTNAGGTGALPNTIGVHLQNAYGNSVGGAGAGQGNFISGNDFSGIYLDQFATTSNTIQGNTIGLSTQGTALGNGNNGIILSAGQGNIVGGAGNAGNVISGNGLNPTAGSGVTPGGISLFSISNTTVVGNLIGTDAAGTAARPNLNGVVLEGDAGSNRIGGQAAGEPNTIAFNSSDGVLVTDANTQGNTISRNSIFNNGALGINLATAGQQPNGVTPNDALDADTGPNNAQNFPDIAVATFPSAGGTVTVSGTLNSRPSRDYRIEVFNSAAADPSTYGEGQAFKGSVDVTTDAQGSAPFQITVSGPITSLSATATDVLSGDTSEFSQARAPIQAALSLSIAPPLVSEGDGAAAATGTVSRNTSTSNALTVMLASSDTSEATVPASVVIPAGATSITFPIRAIDDRIADGTRVVNISASASGFTSDSASLSVSDNDSPGVAIAPTSGLITSEDKATATFSVVLNTQPTADVSVDLASSDATEGTVSPATLTFTALNYDTPRTVTITGVDDAAVDGDKSYSIITSVRSTDAGYASINPPDVSVINRDNDRGQLSISAAISTLAEGQSTTATISRTGPATAAIVVTIVSSTPGLSVPQTVRIEAGQSRSAPFAIAAIDNDVVEGARTIVLTASSPGSGLGEGSGALRITDNDTASIIVTPVSGLETSEAGGGDLFTVALSTRPSANVSIALSSSDPSEGTVSPAALLFTPQNYATPQAVTVRGVDDAIVDGDKSYTIVTAPAVSTDADYNDLNAPDVSVVNRDNDAPQLSISPATSTLAEGASATFTVTRTGSLQSALSVTLLSSAPGSLSVPVTVTIAAGAASATFTASAPDDNIANGTRQATITASAAGLGSDQSTLSISDDDIASIIVSPSEGLVTNESGATAAFTVRLGSRPASNVLIALSSSDAGEGTPAPSTLTFTPDNFGVAQTVTVKGVDDAIVDGAVSYTIVTSPAQSEDANFSGLDAPNVSLTNRDNDAPALFLSIAPTSIVEGGGATATLSRNTSGTATTAPALSVRISSSPGEQVSLPASVSIPAGRASVTFTIRAEDDKANQGARNITISAARAGFTSGSAQVTILDNDGPSLTVVATPASFSEEAGPSASTGTVRLNTTASTALSVSLSSSDITRVRVPAKVTINAGKDSVSFPIQALGDDVADGPQIVSIQARATGVDPGTFALTVTDDDAPSLQLAVTPAIFSEKAGPHAASARITRNFNLSDALTITISVSSTGTTIPRAASAPASVVIPARQTSASFEVSALNDALAQGRRIAVLKVSGGGRAAQQTLQVLDDDVIAVSITPTQRTLKAGEKLDFNATVSGVTASNAGVAFSIEEGPRGGTITATGLYTAGATPGTYHIVATSRADRRRTARATVTVVAAMVPTPTPPPTPTPVPTPGVPVSAWGSNAFGQLGVGSTGDSDLVVQAATRDAVSVSANGSHSLAVQRDGSVQSWGYNGSGQLGDGTRANRSRPVFVLGPAGSGASARLSDIDQVAAGWYHSLALRGDGSVWAWGRNPNGQLGNSNPTSALRPVRVRGLGPVKFIAAGVDFSAAITRDGALYLWGKNSSGQLGSGGTASSSVPRRVLDQDGQPLTGITFVSLGSEHALAVGANGRAWAWGANSDGRLGLGSTTDSDRARMIVSVSGDGSTRVPAPAWKGVAAGFSHSLLLSNAGRVFACGNNFYGQLGRADQAPASTCIQVASLSGITSIAAGAGHSLALSPDGSVRAWGWNELGSLGDGTRINRSAPVQVRGLSRASQISAGYGHTLAIRAR